MATGLLGLLTLWTLVVTLRWGASRVLAYAYLPAVLFGFFLPPVSLPSIPNLTASSAVGYMLPVALVLRRFVYGPNTSGHPALRLNLIDVIVLLMLVPPAIAVASNEGAWQAISQAGDFAFLWILPYFLGRVALTDPTARKHTLIALAISACAIGVLAAYEARLSPYFVARQLKRYNLTSILGIEAVLYRFGLARALVTMGQPIDLGVCGVLVGTMILILTPSTNQRWHQLVPLAGILGAGAMVMFSVSFTAWLAMGSAFALYAVLSRPRLGGYLATPIMVVTICVMIYLTHSLLNEEMTERPQGDPAAESKWIRKRILQDAWPYVDQAGMFGFGPENVKKIASGTASTDPALMASLYDVTAEKIGVGSIDNAYVVFIMEMGWIYLILWIALAIVMAVKAGRALSRVAANPAMRLPMAAGLAGCIATFFAMYTVFYGFVYGVMLCVLFGMISSMAQLFTTSNAAPQQVPYATQASPMSSPSSYGPPYVSPPAAGSMR